jgi:PAS domain-containing protein
VAHPVELWDGEIVPKVSVGYARYPEDGADGHEISAAADRMMYEYKERRHAAESEGFEVEDALERIQDFDLYQTIKCLPVPYAIYRVADRLDILFANDAFLAIAGAPSLESFVEETLGALDAVFSDKDADILRHLVTTGATEAVGLRKNLVEMHCLDGVSRLLEFRAFGVDNSRGEAIVCAVVKEETSA